jgi:glycerol-3-phosphate dehydrogenase
VYNSDILIIGAGAVGIALAREFSKYKLKVIVIDKKDDIGGDASKSCTGLISTEYSVPPFTLEGKIAPAAKPMSYKLCEDLDIPINHCGMLIIAINEEQKERISLMLKKGFDNNVQDLEPVTREEILEMEPNINPAVLAGIYDARTSHVNVFEYIIAQAENAAENGVEFFLDCKVLDIEVNNGIMEKVITTKGEFKAKWVINSAGLYCDEIAKMVGECDFKIYPRKGHFILLDRETSVKVKHVIGLIPSPTLRGANVVPTSEGNILLGATAEDLQDKDDKKTTFDGFQELIATARQMVPDLHIEDTITQFTGLRPARDPEGYNILISRKVSGYVGISGIRSSGLTGSLSIAKYVMQYMQDAGLVLERRNGYIRKRKRIVNFKEASIEEKNCLIKQNPYYGHIICRCETITEAEIIQAIHRPLGAQTMDAVKRRCRPGLGRCQGGFCGPQVMALLERELGFKPEDLRKRDGKSFMIV